MFSDLLTSHKILTQLTKENTFKKLIRYIVYKKRKKHTICMEFYTDVWQLKSSKNKFVKLKQ